jgi:4-hydroxythreonine-4-phosphate dehydrogenase
MRHPDESSFMRELAGVSLVKPVVKWNHIFRCTVVGHVAFANILEHLRRDSIVETIECLGNTISRCLETNPRIGVAGLNPHAGEGGNFGNEESTLLTPAINEARKRFHFDISGPFPADTIMHRALKGNMDGIVYLYHDQGNIAMKAIGFHEAVLIYSGLPVDVTSPGHGAAYDIAGEGRADHSNFRGALQTCMELVRSGKSTHSGASSGVG